MLENREEQEVQDKKTRKKEDATHGRGVKCGWVWSHSRGKEEVRMMSGSQVIKCICIGHFILSTIKNQYLL